MMNEDNSRLRLRREGSLHAYLELIRLPNIFTAVADVAMGFLFMQAVAGPGDAAALGLLILASGLLYASGVVLNDVFDFPLDARHRPQRPLPSGRIRRGVAAWLGWELLLLGVAAAWLASFLAGHFRPGVVAALLAGCIVAYDTLLKRTPAGPLAMGGCRMLNVLLGMSVAVDPLTAAAVSWQAQHWLVAGGVGTYIAGVTWFARTEARQSNSLQLGLAVAVMMGGVSLLAWFPSWIPGPRPIRFQLDQWQLMMAVVGALIAWRCVQAVFEPIPARVQMAVKHCILSLVILDASVCLAVRDVRSAMMVLALIVPVMFLGQWIEST